MDDVKFYSGLSLASDGRAVFRGTSFVERPAPLNQCGLWMRWGDYMVVDAYSDFESELLAVGNGVAMGDMSPVIPQYMDSGRFPGLLGRCRSSRLHDPDLSIDLRPGDPQPEITGRAAPREPRAAPSDRDPQARCTEAGPLFQNRLPDLHLAPAVLACVYEVASYRPPKDADAVAPRELPSFQISLALD